MARALLFVLCLLCLAPESSNAWTHGNAGLTCPANDGTSGAPSATIQHPSLLAGYATTITSKLGCNVAGVNYAVGYPASTTLSDPSTATLPSGASYANNVVTVNSASLVTLNAFDFSLHGGIQLLVIGTGGVTVTDSNFGFAAGLTAGEIQCNTGAGGNLTIEYSKINGGGAGGGGAAAYPLAIYNNGCANVTLEYDWITNLPGNVLTQNVSGAVTYEYNLIELTALYPSDHLNLLQWSGGNSTNSVTVQFNTVVEYITGTLGGEIFQFYNNAGEGGYDNDILTSANVGYNTIVSSFSNPDAVARQNSTTYSMGQVLTVSGSSLKAYQVCAGTSWNTSANCLGGNGTSTCTTASSQPSGYTTEPQATGFTDGTCFIQGSNYAVSYFMHGSNDASFITKMSPGAATMHDNYFDATASLNGDVSCISGGQSIFYPGTWGTANGPSGTVAWTAPSNNYDMVSGNPIACANSYL